MKTGDVLVLTPRSRYGRNLVKKTGNIVKVKYIQPGKFCVEHWNQSCRWIDTQYDKDFDLNIKYSFIVIWLLFIVVNLVMVWLGLLKNLVGY